MDSDDRIELLLRLQTATFEQRVVAEVLASLTPEERKTLVENVIASVEKRIDTMSVYEIDKGNVIGNAIHRWIDQVATQTANQEWSTKWYPRIAAKTVAAMETAFGDVELTKAVAKSIDALKAPAIRGVVESAIRHLRNWKPTQ